MAKNYNADPIDVIYGISIAGFFTTMIGIDVCLILRELNKRHLFNKAFDTACKLNDNNTSVSSDHKNAMEFFDDFVNDCV